MRIVGGEWGGRRLEAPASGVRPTQDRVRQILFDILGPGAIEGAVVLDLYAGSGALGLEALSRGASRAVFVEASARARPVIERNRRALDAIGHSRLLGMPVLRALALLAREGGEFDLVLADPPYDDPDTPRLVEALGREESGILRERGRFVLETGRAEPMPDAAGFLRCVRRRIVGDTALHFYLREARGEDMGR